MLRKAFLAHSSKDKAIVRAVAGELGRHDSLYDEESFETGIEFGEAIKKGLNDALVFVFFASQNSLKNVSEWIVVEQEQAQARLDSGQIRRALVFIIDDSIKPGDLPDWMQRAKADHQKSPNIIARDIRRHISELVAQDQQPVFLGRGQALDAAQKLILPVGAERRSFLLYGIQGIGKRSLCRKIGESLFTLPTLCELRIAEGDDLADIAIKLADATSEIVTRAELDRFTREVRAATETQLLSSVRESFRRLIDGRQLPLFFDAGGLLDNDGHISTAVSQAGTIVTKANRLYLALVTSRRPNEADPATNELPAFRVDALAEDDIKQLLGVLADRSGITLKADALGKVAHAVRGYPPAAYYAIELIARDGLTLFLESDSELIAFRTGIFLRALERDVLMTTHRKSILRALAEYESLPLDSIKELTHLKGAALWEEMRYLLDCAFVVPQRDDTYRIADPLVDSVARLFRDDRLDHQAILRGLQRYIADRADATPLDVQRSLWQAATSSGDSSARQTAYYLASDVIKLLKQSFHRKQFEKAIELGKEAVEMRPDSVQARSYFIRALIQRELYDEALAEMEMLKVRRQFREYYYLLGYLEQRRERFPESIAAFGESIRHGRNDSTIHREIAESFLYTEDYSSAAHHASLAQKREPDNKFIVDLFIRAHTKNGDLESARQGLATLKLLDDSSYYLHRRAVVEYASNDVPAALDSEREALRQGPTSPHMLAFLIICELAAGDIESAQAHINEFSIKYKVKQDIATSLKARVAIARRNFEDALLLLDGLKNKTSLVQVEIRRQALAGFLRHIGSCDPRYAQLSEQLTKLEARLAGASNRILELDVIGEGI